MRIDRLSMTGFGRFQGKNLKLTPGLNILAGPNEAGKTTVQKFILGMLYGFKKRGQRREFTDDAFRYKPWQGGEYRGALVYTLESGRSFRVERDFDPSLDTVRLFDEATGADLTEKFTWDRRKELMFAEEQLKLPEEIFRSTAWVGQLQVGNLELGRELLTRLANMQESGRDDLSVKDALAYLEEQIRLIGSERAPTRPYARMLKQMEEKQQELKDVTAQREQVRRWELRLSEVRAALAQVEEEQAGLRRRLSGALLKEASVRLAKVEEATQKQEALAAEMASLRRYAAFPVQHRDRLLRLQSESDTARRRATEMGAAERPFLESEIARLGAMIAEFAAVVEPLLPAARGGDQVLSQVETLDAQIGVQRAKLDKLNSESLRESVRQLRQQSRSSGGLSWLWGSISLVSLVGAAAVYLVPGLSRLVPAPFDTYLPIGLGALGLLFLTLTVVTLLRLRKSDMELAETRAELEQSLEAEEMARRKIFELEDEKRRLLSSVNAASSGDVHRAVTRYQQLTAMREKNQARLEQLQSRVNDIRTELDRIRQLDGEITALLAEAGVESAEQFETACTLHEAWQKAEQEAATADAVLQSLLGGQDPAALAVEVRQLRERAGGYPPDDPRSVADLQEEMRRLESQRSDLATSAADLAARVETGLAELPEIADLAQEIEALTEQKANFDEELAALELARQTLTDAREQIHREFAPMLNEAMAKSVDKLTAGKYQAVKVDEELAIRAVGEGDRMVDLLSLSGGTIDQFYLGLRLALLEMIQGPESIPVMLDDPFVQYDDDRVRTAMGLLAEMAKTHQVIFMTCHRREVKMAESLGIAANIINLTDTVGATAQ